MALLTAILTALVFAIFGFPFRHYQCWYSWSSWGTVSGLTLYLFIAGGGGGALGWAAATIGHAQPTTNELLNGILYGLGGALALRADFGAQPKRSPADNLRDAKSILTRSINWTADSLDENTKRRAEGWLRSLDDEDLLLEAYRVHADIARQPSKKISDKAKTDTLTRLVELMEKLVDEPTKNERAATRAHLEDFCARYYPSEHLPKPPGTKRPAPTVTAT